MSSEKVTTENTEKAPAPKKRSVKSVLKFLSGIDAIESGVRSNIAIDYEIANSVKTMAQIAFAKNTSVAPVNSDSSNPEQRFMDAQKQYKVSDKEMSERLARSEKMFNINLLCLAIFVASAIITAPNAFAYGFVATILFLLPAVFGTIMFTANLFKWGFWNCQLRNRSLVKASFFLKNPKQWLPSSEFKRKKSGVLALGLLAALALSPMNSARAADDSAVCTGQGSNYVTNTFSLPCQKDIYRNALETIFPDVGPLSTPAITTNTNGYTSDSNGQSAVAEAFMAFIVVLMTVAMAQMTWHIVGLIVAAAHEGTSVAQKWSGIWVPMRLFVGAGILAPYVKGYCLAQVLVLYAALWSGSFANIIWSAYIQGLDNPQISSNASLPFLTPALRGLVMDDVCYNIVSRQKAVATSQGAEFDVQLPTQNPWTPKITQDDGDVDYAAKINDVFDTSVFNSNRKVEISPSTLQKATWDFGPTCGSVSIPFVSTASQTQALSGSNAASGLFAAYDKKKIAAITKFAQDMDKSVSKVVNNAIGASSDIPSNLSSDVVGVMTQYQTETGTAYSSIAQAAQTFLDGVNSSSGTNRMTTFQQNARTYGWMSSGSFYMNISRMQGMVDAFLTIAPSASSQSADVTNILNSGSAISKLIGTTGASADVLNKFVVAFSNVQSAESTTQASSTLSTGAQTGNIAGLTIYNNTIGLDNPNTPVGRVVDAVSSWIGSKLTAFINKTTGLDATGASSGSSGVQGSELQNMTEFGQNILTITGLLFTLLVFGAGAFLVSGGVGGSLAAKALGTAAKAASWFGGDVVGKIGQTLMTALFWLMGSMLVVGVLHAYIIPMMPYIQFLLFGMSMLIIVVEAVIAAPIWAFMHFRLDGQEMVGHSQQAGYMLIFNLFLRVPLAMLGMLLSISVFNATMLILAMTFYPAVQSAMGDGGTGLIGSIVMLLLMSYLHYQIAVRSFSLISSVPSRVSKWFGASMTEEHEHSMMSNIGSFMVGQAATSAPRVMGAMFGRENQRRQPPQRNGGGGSGGGNGGSGGGAPIMSPEGPTGGPTEGVEGAVSAIDSAHSSADMGSDTSGGAGVQNSSTSTGGDAESSQTTPGSMPAGSMATFGRSLINAPDNQEKVSQLGGHAEGERLVQSFSDYAQNNGDVSEMGLRTFANNFVNNSSVSGDRSTMNFIALDFLTQMKNGA